MRVCACVYDVTVCVRVLPILVWRWSKEPTPALTHSARSTSYAAP